MVVACTIASSIAMAALVIDVGNLLETKAELQMVADLSAKSAALKSILNGLRLGTYVSPAIDTDSTSFIFSGGAITSAIAEAVDLYEAKKNADGELAVLIPVYDQDDCTNPNSWIRIIGVARAVITHVETGGDKRIDARVQCDVIDIGESGGSDFGVLAAGPDLVR